MNPYPPITELLPHRPPLVLLEGVVHYDETGIICETTVRPDGLFVQDGRVAAVVNLEYMAQTIGAFVGLQARIQGEPVKIGFLVGCNDMQLMRDDMAIGTHIQIEARNTWGNENAGHFDCVCRVADEVIAKAGLSVYQPNDLKGLRK